jgi:hypothetical protein
MSRLFKLLLVLSAFAVVLSSIAWADTKEADSTYFSENRYITIGTTDPGTTDLTNGGTWKFLGTSDATISPAETINTGTSKWLGINNGYRPEKYKVITVYLQGTGLNNLQLSDQYGVVAGNKTPGALLETSAHSSTQFIMKFGFNPQPSWEVLKLTSTGSASITNFYIVYDCNPKAVPTLTQYGLGVLILLLIATAVVVYRRRHRVIA